MKKSIYLGIIALATLSLASCSKNEVIESVPQQSAIEFGTYLGRDITTRGTVWNTDAMKGEDAGFGVFAFYTGQATWADYTLTTPTAPNFMYNQNVEWNGTDAWTYSPKKYWPATKAGADADKITFFAYAPMASTTDTGNGMIVSANTATGTPTVTYTIDPGNLDKMADFVADALIDETKKADDNDGLNNVNEPVVFALNHELTRVNIQAQLSADAYGSTAADKTKVNITDIKFVGDGFATTGTYTFAQADDTRGSWEYNNATSPVSIFNTDAATANFVNWTTPTEFGTYATKGVSVPTTDLVSLFKTDDDDDEYLFLIPPKGTDGIDASTKVQMQVYYDIVTYDVALVGNHSKTSAVKEIDIPATLLKQGTAYNLVLTFGMNEITLSATVDGWNDPATGVDENVDYDDTDIY